MSNPLSKRWLQFSLRGLLALMTFLAVGFGFTWQFWPWWKERVLVSQLRERVLQAKNSGEAGRAYYALLQPPMRRRLERLAQDDDPSIALKASFELLAHRTDGYAKLPPESQSGKDSSPDTARLVEPGSAGGVSQSCAREVFTYGHKVNDEKSVILTSDSRQLVFTADQFEKIRVLSFSGDHIALQIGSSHSYLATFDNVGWGYELYCLDSATGRTVWKSKVWATGVDNLGGITGQWSHGAQIEVRDERVIVWGAGTGGTYVEVFDAATGACELRFCTEYWYSQTFQ